MSIPHAAAGRAAELQLPDGLVSEAETFVLVKNEAFEATETYAKSIARKIKFQLSLARLANLQMP